MLGNCFNLVFRLVLFLAIHCNVWALSAAVLQHDASSDCLYCPEEFQTQLTYTVTIPQGWNYSGEISPPPYDNPCTVQLSVSYCAVMSPELGIRYYYVSIDEICFGCPSIDKRYVIYSAIVSSLFSYGPGSLLNSLGFSSDPVGEMIGIVWRWPTCSSVIQCAAGVHCVKKCECELQNSNGGVFKYDTPCERCCELFIQGERTDCGVLWDIPWLDINTLFSRYPRDKKVCEEFRAQPADTCNPEESFVLTQPCFYGCIDHGLVDIKRLSIEVEP